MKHFFTLFLVVLLVGCGGGGSNEQGLVAAGQGPVDTRVAAFTQVRTVALFWGKRLDYTVSASTDQLSISVKDNVGADGLRVVEGPATLQFRDVSVALQGDDGNAAKLYRLYRAALDRNGDEAGLGYWIYALDNGAQLRSVAELFISSAESIQLYGANTSNADFVTQLFKNVLKRSPDEAGLAYWVKYLDDRVGTRADALIQFSESAENKTAFSASIKDGIAFTDLNKQSLPLGPGGDTKRIFSGARINYSIQDAADATTITDTLGRDGTTTVTGPAVLIFTDTAVAVRANDSVAGRIFRLYRSAFRRDADASGLGYYIYKLDTGSSLESIAASFMASSEFTQRYGANVSNSDFIDLLYTNVLNRAADAPGRQFWTDYLAQGGSRAAMLVLFSEGTENKANTFAAVRAGLAFKIANPSAIPAGTGLIIQRNFSTFNVLDKDSLTVKLQSNCGTSFYAMDISPNGNIIAVVGNDIFEANPLVPTCRKLGRLTDKLISVAVSPQGVIYGIGFDYLTDENTGRGYKKFVTVWDAGSNGGTARSSSVALSGATSYVNSLDMGPDGELYGYGIMGDGKWGLARIDKYTGQTTAVGSTTFNKPIEYDVDIDTTGVLRGMNDNALMSYAYRTGTFISARTVASFTDINEFSPITFVP